MKTLQTYLVREICATLMMTVAVFTFVLREKREMLGLVQGTARPGHDAWDLLRLALLTADPEDRERAADALLEHFLVAASGR